MIDLYNAIQNLNLKKKQNITTFTKVEFIAGLY